MPASTLIMFPLSDPVRWLFVIVLCDSSRDDRVHSVWCALCVETLSNLCDGLEICFSACLCCFTPCLSSVFCPLFLCRSLIMANFACAHSLFLYQLCNLWSFYLLMLFLPTLFLPSVILLYAQSASARTVDSLFFFSILFHTINLRTVVTCPL